MLWNTHIEKGTRLNLICVYHKEKYRYRLLIRGVKIISVSDITDNIGRYCDSDRRFQLNYGH